MDEIKVGTTLRDPVSESNEELEVLITIDDQGVLIQLADPTKGWGDGTKNMFRKEVWVEFYCGQLLVHLWNGTQEDPNVTLDILGG